MVDEAHERSIYTDVLLGLLKKIQRKRKDLRVSCERSLSRFSIFYAVLAKLCTRHILPAALLTDVVLSARSSFRQQPWTLSN